MQIRIVNSNPFLNYKFVEISWKRSKDGIKGQDEERRDPQGLLLECFNKYLSTVSAITGEVTHDRGPDKGIATIDCTACFGPDEGAAFCKLAKGTGVILLLKRLLPLPVTKQSKNTLHIKRMRTFVENVKAEYRLRKTTYAQPLWKEKELKQLYPLLTLEHTRTT
uniref:Uncharacterized protein n=1 Tax=Glossina austeni TaxID=7395 RepID=A0A1A9UGG4_GLOAU